MPMRMPNANIPLATRLPQSRSPVQTIGNLAQLRDFQEVTEQRRLTNEQRRIAMEDDDAIRRALQQHERPDDAMEELYRAGRGSAASSLGKQLWDWRSKKAEAAAKDLENGHSRLKMSTQIAQGIKDESTFQSAKRAIVSLLGEEAAAEIGAQYDPDRVKMLVAWGTDRTDFLRQQQDAVNNGRQAQQFYLNALKAGSDLTEANQKAREYWTKSASTLLGTATSQPEWDAYRGILDQAGTPQDVLVTFGDQWSTDAVARAKQIGLSPKEQADVAHQQVTERRQAATLAETTRHHRETETQSRAGGRTGAGSLTANRRADAEQWKARQYDEFEKQHFYEIEDIRKLTAALANPTAKTRQPREEMTLELQRLQQQLGQKKLSIEDSYRGMLGEGPLIDTEFNTDPTNAPALAKIRRTYRSLTGEDTPLEQMEKLVGQIREERNHTKRAALQKELKALRSRYREQYGR